MCGAACHKLKHRIAQTDLQFCIGKRSAAILPCMRPRDSMRAPKRVETPITWSRRNAFICVAACTDADQLFDYQRHWNPYFVEGVKSMAYELWEQLGFKAPDNIICPPGNGSITLGLAQGFSELLANGEVAHLPCLLPVQPENCNPIWRKFWNVDTPFEAKETVAEGSALEYPSKCKEVVEAVRRSQGELVSVTKGYFVEPTSSAAFAGASKRIAAGKINRNMELKTKSVKELIIENLCTLFNLINVILAFLVILTGSFKNLTFLFVVFLNTAIGVIQSMRSKKMVDKLTLLTSKKAIAVRDGSEVELDLDQIVLDDIIRLGRGDQIPADAVVVSGEALVNESLLTGESDLIKKQPGSELMSGSFIDSGLLRARVIHVGADNYVAKINNEAKYVKKVNSEIMNALNAIVRFASIIMIPLGLALFASSVSELWDAAGTPGNSALSWCFSELLAGHVPSSALLSTVGALLGMIPQGLVLLTSSVLAIATVRLARRKVLAQQLYCIETLARVDVLCLDKTGTITSGRMEVEGTYPLPVEGMGAGEGDAAVPVDTTVLDFALANVARATSADANETCQALLNYYADRPVEVSEPLSVIPFSSSKKWSGASFAQGSYVMGAAQFVLSDRAFAQVENRVAELADTCRVLVVACVDGFTPDGDMVGEAEPVGFVTIRDEIRTSAAETIGYFNEQGVTLNVISGDDPRTVSSIARVVGVPGADAYVDATTLDTPAKLDAAVDRYHVFGRVTPQQKRELVQALKRREHTVAMTGDGVNDVLALKEADCSIAMASGSDVACQVSHIVLLDSNFASMPSVVAEGRRVINNIERSASLYLVKNIFSFCLAFFTLFATLPYPFSPAQLTLVSAVTIGIPSFILAMEPNESLVKGKFLRNVLFRALPAAMTDLAMVVGILLFYIAFQLDDTAMITICTGVMGIVGLMMVHRTCQPYNTIRKVMIVVLGVLFVIAYFGFPTLFNLQKLDLQSALILIVFGLLSWPVMKAFCRLNDHMRTRFEAWRAGKTAKAA